MRHRFLFSISLFVAIGIFAPAVFSASSYDGRDIHGVCDELIRQCQTPPAGQSCVLDFRRGWMIDGGIHSYYLAKFSGNPRRQYCIIPKDDNPKCPDGDVLSGGMCEADSDGDGDPDKSDPKPNDPDCSNSAFDQFKCPRPGDDGSPDDSSDDDSNNNPDEPSNPDDPNNPGNDPDSNPDNNPGNNPDDNGNNNPDGGDDSSGGGSGDNDGDTSGGNNDGGGSNGGGNNNGPSVPPEDQYTCPDGSSPDAQFRCPPSEPHYGPDPHPDGDNRTCEDGYPPKSGSCDRPSPNNFCPDGRPRWPGTSCPADPDNDDPNPPENPPPDNYNPRPIPPDGDGPPDDNPDPSPGPGNNPTPTPGPGPGPGDPVDPDHNPNPDPDSPNNPTPNPGDDSSGGNGDDGNGDGSDDGAGAESLGKSCEAEPPCVGNDPVMCGIQLQTWKTRCQGEGASAGTCSENSQPECMEGTVQCEMLKQQHTLLCGEEVKLEDFKTAFKGAGITEDDKLTDNYLKDKRTVDNESQLRGLLESLRPPGLGGRTLGDQCYPIPPIVIFGSTVDIDIRHICKLLEVISMLMYLAAYIAGFHILFKAISED